MSPNSGNVQTLMRMRQWGGFRIAALVLVMLGTFACTKKHVAPPITNSSEPQWVTPEKQRSKGVAVVFVHGIFGDTLGTWTNDTGESFFHLLKAHPDVGPKVDIFAFGFTSNMFKQGSFDVREAEKQLQASLESKKVLDYPAVVFVAHGMGGLIVMSNLLYNRALLDKVRLIVLYSTPQEAAQIARIANVVAKSPDLVKMFTTDRDSFLQTLSDDWRRIKSPPPVKCGYEKHATDGRIVVEWTSARRFCDRVPSAIDENHMGVAKPDRAEHDSVVLLVNALNEHVFGKSMVAKPETPDVQQEGKSMVAKLETPDFQREGDLWVFRLNDPNGKSEARLVNAGDTDLRYTIAQLSERDLYLWPDDTPREIAPHKVVRLRMALGKDAKEKEYRFVLKTDVSPDQSIIVRVPDLTAARAKQAALVQAVSQEINTFLSYPRNEKDLMREPANTGYASDQVVTAAGNAVAHEIPGLTEAAKWVISADVLAALNWPELAAIALRRAEVASPSTVKMPATQHLAAVIAGRSGERQVFANTETPVPNVQDLPKTDVMTVWIDKADTESWRQLAERLRSVPALRRYGLTLEGDVWQAKGNREAAMRAYKDAAALKSTPWINYRIKELGGISDLQRLDCGDRPVPSNARPGSGGSCQTRVAQRRVPRHGRRRTRPADPE